MDVDVSTSVAGNKPQRIRRIQTVTLVLLFMAGIVNFLDRSSLSVAGEAIRGPKRSSKIPEGSCEKP